MNLTVTLCAHCDSDEARDRLETDLASFLLCDDCWEQFLAEVASDYGMVTT